MAVLPFRRDRLNDCFPMCITVIGAYRQMGVYVEISARIEEVCETRLAIYGRPV